MPSWSGEARSLLRLALPAVVAQVGLMAMGVVDTVMVGHIPAGSAADGALAAVALGSLYCWICLVFAAGCLMALDPVVAQAVGAGDHVAIAKGLQRGLLLAAILSLPSMVLHLPAATVFSALRQPAEVVPRAATYALISVPGVLPFLGFVVLRQTLQGLGRMRPIVFTIVAANLVNVILNWILIFGHWGFPALGVAGSAWATVASRWCLALGLLLSATGPLRPYLRPLKKEVMRLGPLLRMARLGAPIGFQYLLEFGAFGAAALFMGWIGAREMGGHQVALNLASLTFNVPLGLSGAAAVRVGLAVGRNDALGLRRAASTALGAAVSIMAVFGLVFLSLPETLSRLYTGRPEILDVAVSLIPIAGVFQIFDGLQVVSIGILRGLGDTRTPMVMNVLGFWLLGIPASLLLAFGLTGGPRGLWWGLVVGLGSVAGLLLLRLRVRLRAQLVRVVIDDEATPLVSAASTPCPE